MVSELSGLKVLSDAVNTRKREILNTKHTLEIGGVTYYVSNEGNDENDGLSEGSAWKTLRRVSDANLKYGDGVLFRRGDLFRGMITARDGVSYGAYGKGDKPKLYGWDKSLADAGLWELYDKEHYIWRLTEKNTRPRHTCF